MTTDDSVRRLARLGAILNDTRVRHDNSAHGGDLPLAGGHLERIQRLTRTLDDRVGREIDELDRVAIRLLLDEYATVVAHLRGVLRHAATTVAEARPALKTIRRAVEQQRQLETESVAAAPSEPPPASQSRDT